MPRRARIKKLEDARRAPVVLFSGTLGHALLEEELGMSEIGIGLLFAFWFVLGYLLVSRLLGSDKCGQIRWRDILRPSTDAAKALGAKRPHLFLSTSELSEHHSRTTGKSSSGKDR
jgi:hypothetical protein